MDQFLSLVGWLETIDLSRMIHMAYCRELSRSVILISSNYDLGHVFA